MKNQKQVIGSEYFRLTFREANISDLPLLRHWDQQPHVIAADPNDDWHWEVELTQNFPWRQQIIAELDGKPLGFIQIIDPAEEVTHYWGDIGPHKRAIDIWIGEERHLGRGYGARMMSWALATCFSDPKVTEVLIDPLATNTRAIRFYQRLGFSYVETRTFGEDVSDVHVISREAWLEKG